MRLTSLLQSPFWLLVLNNHGVGMTSLFYDGNKSKCSKPPTSFRPHFFIAIAQPELGESQQMASGKRFFITHGEITNFNGKFHYFYGHVQ